MLARNAIGFIRWMVQVFGRVLSSCSLFFESSFPSFACIVRKGRAFFSQNGVNVNMRQSLSQHSRYHNRKIWCSYNRNQAKVKDKSGNIQGLDSNVTRSEKFSISLQEVASTNWACPCLESFADARRGERVLGCFQTSPCAPESQKSVFAKAEGETDAEDPDSRDSDI